MTDGDRLPRHGASEVHAGDPVPADGIYELHNVFGTPTGRRIELAAGERVPDAPHGWSWRPVASR